MKAAIFDIDGTLVDSVDFHAKAWQKAFQHFGHEVSFENVRSQIGKGGDQLMPVFLPREEVESKGEEIEKYRGEIFKKDYLPRVLAFPKVRELFEKIRDDGWKIALASSAKKEELKTYTELCQIGDLIEAETSSDDAEKSKPHPDIFLAAMDRLQDVTPSDCMVIGDSPYDAEAAAKAGVRAIGFLCGGFSEDRLRGAGYEAIYRDASDVLAQYTNRYFISKNLNPFDICSDF